jgi:hypothetical protein
VPSTLGTVSDPCLTTDILKRATDNENHADIDISKEFSQIKCCFRLCVSIPLGTDEPAFRWPNPPSSAYHGEKWIFSRFLSKKKVFPLSLMFLSIYMWTITNLNLRRYQVQGVKPLQDKRQFAREVNLDSTQVEQQVGRKKRLGQKEEERLSRDEKG